ncbi:MAG: metallophosphoesterase, partial [Solirubrobacteraceae bacterium]
MRTLVISDLHLGATTRGDLLRRAELREPLLEAVRDVDRLVILGDGLELRDGPQRAAPELAGALFGDLGRALGPDGELLVLAGNHDHGLVAGWIDSRLLTEPSGFLGLEQLIEPGDAGPLAAALAERAAPARVRFAYPGVWLRDDVFAIHGHYSDVHATVPTFERLAAGAMARWAVTLPADGALPDDYEAVLAPIYAWIHALTQRSDRAVMSAGAGVSSRAWVALGGRGRRRRPIRTAALSAGFAAAVAGVNTLGI